MLIFLIIQRKFENEILKKQKMFKTEENEVRGLPNELEVIETPNKNNVTSRIKVVCQHK